jgi:adenylate kinase family enzyme
MDKSYQVYLIEDINDLRYYGMSSSTLQKRLMIHQSEYRNIYGKCSSCRLNLYNSIITCLDNNLTKKEAIELEKYYIKNNDCVNKIKYKNEDERKKALQEYQEKNKEKIKKQRKKYRQENKDKIKSYKRTIWHCDICNCDLTLNCKSRHLKSPKHINNSLK